MEKRTWSTTWRNCKTNWGSNERKKGTTWKVDFLRNG